MNLTTVAIGLAMIAYGVVTTVLRVVRPQTFWKLERMKKFWGQRAGFWIHVVGYSVVPIVAGAWFVFRGMSGLALF